MGQQLDSSISEDMSKVIPFLVRRSNPFIQETRCFLFVISNSVFKVLESSYVLDFLITIGNQTFFALYFLISIEGHSFKFTVLHLQTETWKGSVANFKDGVHVFYRV